ncbi:MULTISPECIES: hypothetical protein [unclassified Streptomyces]|uniref:hypothetical protein n=1 Tax=unclassified Streptomyces TaxID=2593676 RepID=UPI00102CF25C|nr:hypothetical protein [Streptomyces sp. BK239]RZU15231.1 hypothetical protein EV567_4219 [Streptomyces sp. BK239]
MRNLRKAALVAAMIGTLGFVGAGTASAGDGRHGDDAKQCVQGAEQGDPNFQIGLINLNQVPLLGALSKQNTLQQTCVDDGLAFTGSREDSIQAGNGTLSLLPVLGG